MPKTKFAINAIVLHDFYCQKVADGLIDESQNTFEKKRNKKEIAHHHCFGRNNIVRAGNHVTAA